MEESIQYKRFKLTNKYSYGAELNKCIDLIRTTYIHVTLQIKWRKDVRLYYILNINASN